MNKEQEFKKRRENAVKSLILIGETMLAQDLAFSNEKCSFEYCEQVLRRRLKDLGPDGPPFQAQAYASAIYECQTLPHLWQPK